MFWKQTIENIKERISAKQDEVINLEKQVEALYQEAYALFSHGNLNAQKIPTYFEQLLGTNLQYLNQILSDQSFPSVLGWLDPSWADWKVDPNNIDDPSQTAGLIRIGQLVEQRPNNRGIQYSIPKFAPFIGDCKTIIILCNSKSRDLGLSLIQSLVVRTALLLPHQIRYTLCDPANNGGAFLMRRSLPEGLVRENSGELYRDLLEVSRDIRRVKETYLDPEAPSLHLLRKEIRTNERFEGIFVADFPKNYDRRDIEELYKIGNTGSDAGRYLFIHYNEDVPFPRDMSMEGFENSFHIDLRNLRSTYTNCQLKYEPDFAPPPNLQKELLEIVNKAKPPERKLDWDEVVNIPEHQWWKCNSDDIVSDPIGGVGSSNTLNIWFGKGSDGRQCAHGMLGAMTGSGKSTLYHGLILGLAVRYSPEELRFYLIDGKEGVELAPYRSLPHVEVVSLHSAPKLSRSILPELIEEKERRNTLFKRKNFSEFSDYRKLGDQEIKMPRILMIVDEYQELFEGDKDDIASTHLLTLAQQGRSAGIHMLLASQRFGAIGMRNQTAIFGNIHLRIGMKMSHSDIQALTEFGRKGKQLLMTCDLPGKIVVNDSSGDDNSNTVGKVAFLEKDRRDELIQALLVKSTQLEHHQYAKTVVFDGNAQPNLIENPQLQEILDHNNWMSPNEWQTFARKPIDQGGLDVADWFQAEHPKVIWLGQEFSVRRQAIMILRRRPSENAVLVGGDFNTARYGMLTSILVSLVVSGKPQNIQFAIFDRSIPGTQWHTALEQVCECVLNPSGFPITFTRGSRNVGKFLDNLLEEFDKRNGLDESEIIHYPSLFVLMTELDRVDELRRQGDGYYGTDSPLGEKLKRLYIEGSSRGIHLILSFSGVRPMSNIIDLKRGLPNFRHRIALQISEDDSFTFVRDRRASRLQVDGSVPIKALYKDMDSDKFIQFKPYSIEAEIDFTEQLYKMSHYLSKWKQDL